MLQLQEQFRNTKKSSSTITEICHALKNLAEALVSCDCKIDEVELVTQILRQLLPTYHSIVDIISGPLLVREKASAQGLMKSQQLVRTRFWLAPFFLLGR